MRLIFDTALYNLRMKMPLLSAFVLEGIVRRRSGLLCFAAVLLFATICLLAQWMRPDLDWRNDPLSNYLKGHYGGWVRGAYYVLSMALILLGAGLYGALRPHARSAAPVLLLVVAGVGLWATAITENDLPYFTHDQENLLHRIAALTTFLSVTSAMMLQSWRFHYDDRWRRHFGLAFPLAVAAFIALWIYAYWHGAPEGLRQKTVITLILMWLGSAAWWLRSQQLQAMQAVPVRPPPD